MSNKTDKFYRGNLSPTSWIDIYDQYGVITTVHNSSRNSEKSEKDANRIVTLLNIFAEIDDIETWMKTNQEHIEGLTKGSAQNANVAIEYGEELAKAKEEIKQLESRLAALTETLGDSILRYHREINELRKENNKLFNRQQELKHSFWERLLFLFRGK